MCLERNEVNNTRKQRSFLGGTDVSLAIIATGVVWGGAIQTKNDYNVSDDVSDEIKMKQLWKNLVSR